MARRKTHDEFVAEVKELFGDEYTVLGHYKNSKTKIKFSHNSETCNNHVFDKAPNSFLRGVRCPVCGNIAKANKRRKTHEQFVKEVEEIGNGEYTVVGKYINALEELTMRHNKCNTEWDTKPTNFLNNRGNCPTCRYRTVSEKLSLTQEEFEKRLLDELYGEFSTKDKYKNNRKIMTFKHKICGRTFQTTSKSLFKYRNCHICTEEIQTKLKTKPHETFVKEVLSLVGDEYSVLGKYINSTTPIKMIHHKCGKEFDYIPNNFLHEDRRCPYCSNKWVYTTEIFQDRIDSIYNKEYRVLDEYINTVTPIRIKHLKCENTWETAPDNLLAGHGCPICGSNSKGEERIKKHLNEHHINFIGQKKFEDCKNINSLPFDFAIYSKDEQLTFLIEYDGKQHFEPVQFGGISLERAVENFKNTQHHDSIKNKYCIDNNIPLLRIPYWEFDNIEAILEKELKKFNLLL